MTVIIIPLRPPGSSGLNAIAGLTGSRVHCYRHHYYHADDLALFQNQADRWKTDPGLTDTWRAGIAAYETLIAQLCQVNSDALAAAAELSHGTIETVLAKSDLQLGMEALLRRSPA